MGKNQKIQILFYAFVVFILTSLLVFLFFGNQNEVTFKIQSADDVIKQQSVLIQDLTSGRVAQNDSVKVLKNKTKNQTLELTKLNSELVEYKKNEKIYNNKIDSLSNIINTYQKSDLMPIKRTKQ